MENVLKSVAVVLVIIALIYWSIDAEKNKNHYKKELAAKILSLKIEYENA
jgi:hypothetical protein